MAGLSMNSAVSAYQLQSPLNKPFSHIYVEKDAMAYPLAQRILDSYPESIRIDIQYYKDVFCRAGQNFAMQKKSPKLILAVNRHVDLHKGSPLCNSFGHENFLYLTHAMNCLYDCEYCYLSGMYPSANVVLFVNVEDYFTEVLKNLPAYVCVSYDTDLMAFENMTGFLAQWIHFCADHKEIVMEVRTKSNGYQSISQLQPIKNVILAWTLSPAEVIRQYERGTASLPARLQCVKEAALAGWRVRICIDPILYTGIGGGWEAVYMKACDEINKALMGIELEGVSLGTFRVPKGFYKRMRHNRPDSALLTFPFENRDGVMCYDKSVEGKMIKLHEREFCRFFTDPEDC